MKPKITFNDKALKNALKNANDKAEKMAKESIEKNGFEITCEHCGKKVSVVKGKNKCSHCGKEIIFSVR